jgi:hypothetical protein
MKYFMNPIMVIMIASLTITGCKKDFKEAKEEEISQEILSKISNLGFNTSNVQRTDGGFLVEGDIFLTEANLNERPTSPKLRIANEEQYRTFNLVTAVPKTIIIKTSGKISKNLSAGIDEAIARYNAENLLISFQRRRGKADAAININLIKNNQYIATAGFPGSNGDPYPEIKFSSTFQDYSIDFIATVISHEIGHCIGFRHTDYMNRNYSCGGRIINEGDETSGVGAVQIPGTSTGADPDSWMLACLSATTNRPFNTNDKIALNYLY